MSGAGFKVLYLIVHTYLGFLIKNQIFVAQRSRATKNLILYFNARPLPYVSKFQRANDRHASFVSRSLSKQRHSFRQS